MRDNQDEVTRRSAYGRASPALQPTCLRVGSVPQGTSLRLRDGVPEWRFSTSRKRASRARHTHHRPAGEAVAMNLHRTHARRTAAARAGFSTSTGASGSMRLSGCPRRHGLCRRAVVAGPTRWRRSGRARSCQCCGPYRGCGRSLCCARCSAVTPGFPTICAAPWSAAESGLWQALHGPERGRHLPAGTPARSARSVGLYRHWAGTRRVDC